ncbi:MAG: glutamine synthetase, partial [Candidatus Nanopelagicales bacterium]
LIAAVLAAGLDGIDNKLTCPDAVEGYAYENDSAEVLPLDFETALNALEANKAMTDQLSAQIVETFLVLKRDEIERYRAEVEDPTTRDVTKWEQDEYLLRY